MTAHAALVIYPGERDPGFLTVIGMRLRVLDVPLALEDGEDPGPPEEVDLVRRHLIVGDWKPGREHIWALYADPGMTPNYGKWAVARFLAELLCRFLRAALGYATTWEEPPDTQTAAPG